MLDSPFNPEIDFFCEDVSFPLESPDNIEHWIIETLTKEEKEYLQIHFIFCSDEYLLEINKTHLDHHFYTDVITFCLSDNPIEADIFISVDRVRENAVSYKSSFLQELHRVMIHGVLHCAGYKDSTPEQKTEMRLKEDYYLSKKQKEV